LPTVCAVLLNGDSESASGMLRYCSTRWSGKVVDHREDQLVDDHLRRVRADLADHVHQLRAGEQLDALGNHDLGRIRRVAQRRLGGADRPVPCRPDRPVAADGEGGAHRKKPGPPPHGN
jgi:hypothetical protein